MLDLLVNMIVQPIGLTIMLSIASLAIVSIFFSTTPVIGGLVHFLAIVSIYSAFATLGTVTATAIFLLIVGSFLVLAELFVPGGIVGMVGFVAIIISLLSIATNQQQMANAILLSLLVAIIGLVIMMKIFGKKLNIFNKMVLKDSTDTESGYVSNVTRTELLGEEATTATALRPSGTAMYGTERLDVVSEGGYIEANTVVEIIEVEGPRIVVRKK